MVLEVAQFLDQRLFDLLFSHVRVRALVELLLTPTQDLT